MSRLTKQIIYGIFYIVLLSLIVFAFYKIFLAPAPGCDNGVRDRGEEGTDCGGVCSEICLPSDMRPLEKLGEVMIFRPSEGRIGLLAKIQNANTIPSDSFFYSFRIYDSEDKLVKTIEGESFIYGGEIKYLPAFVEISGDAAKAELKIDEIHWRSPKNYLQPIILVQNHKETAENGYIKGTGKFVNQDLLDLPSVLVLALFKTSSGKIIGVSKTEIQNVAPGSSRDFTILHPWLNSADLKKTEYFLSAKRP